MTLSPEAIASMVADADAFGIEYGDWPQHIRIAANVRALAAECEILRALNEHATSERERQAAEIERLATNGRAVEAKLETSEMVIADVAATRDQLRLMNTSLRAELKAVTKDRDKLAKWSVEAIDKLEACDRYKAALERIAEAPADMAEQAPWWAREALEAKR